jgi:hypothetical protein
MKIYTGYGLKNHSSVSGRSRNFSTFTHVYPCTGSHPFLYPMDTVVNWPQCENDHVSRLVPKLKCVTPSLDPHTCLHGVELKNRATLQRTVYEVWENTVIMKGINLKLMDVNIFSTPKYEKLVLGMLYVHLCASLVHEKLDRVYLTKVGAWWILWHVNPLLDHSSPIKRAPNAKLQFSWYRLQQSWLNFSHVQGPSP